MASQPLVLTDPNLLAEFVRESEFKTFFEKRYATPPDIAALLFRNGQLIDTFKGAHFSVGGVATAIKSIAGGSTHIAIMLADLKPFQVQLPIRAMSRDNVEIAGLATLELQLVALVLHQPVEVVADLPVGGGGQQSALALHAVAEAIFVLLRHVEAQLHLLTRLAIEVGG